MDTTQTHTGAIIVGYDGSPHADRALRWAADQADLEHRELVVLHAARDDDTRTAIVLGSSVLPISPAELLKHATAVVERGVAAARERHPRLTVTALPQLGDARRELVEHSSTAAMVVVGSRGHGAVTSALVGSVGAHLVRHAHGPVVVCRPGEPGKLHGGVVVAADGSPTAAPVLEQAFRQASLRGLPLTILHRVDGRETLDAERRLLAEATAGFGEKFPDVAVDLQLGEGSVEAALRRPRPWDLVVVGRHPLDTVARRVSHLTATDVVEHSDTVVLIVPQSRD